MGMNQERLTQVILAPVVSEKSTLVADKYEQKLCSRWLPTQPSRK